ncbi:MAG: metal-sensitive transcriptional regulator [Chloroflexi bacterium]|nr:metal-sensitive transcriptional regulator [Chloroflexota bacterium]
MKPDQQSEIIRRLRCTAGHLNAVIKMAEAGQPCEQVLHQLNAVQGALRVTMNRLLICQTLASQAIILNSSSSQKRVAELKRLQSLYTLFMQYPDLHREVSHDRNSF